MYNGGIGIFYVDKVKDVKAFVTVIKLKVSVVGNP